jgi:uncharacterized protein with FMN-binding domain
MKGDSTDMKRAWLIAGGTIGGLGAVMAITPPQLSSNSTGSGLELIPAPAQSAAGASNPTPTATTSGATTKPVATKSAKPAATKGTTATSTASATPTAAATQATSSKAQSGTFTGDPYTMRYGTVQVKITISNGTITDAVAVTAPRGENQRYTDRAIPVMRQKTLAAQSSNITSVSGASYTAYAWYISLQSALSKAGWM